MSIMSIYATIGTRFVKVKTLIVFGLTGLLLGCGIRLRT